MTNCKDFESLPDYKLGRWGENIVRKHVMQSGAMIMSTRDFLKHQGAEDAFDELHDDIIKRSQRGPQLEGKYHQETLTDFVVYLHGRAWWVEVKTKSEIGKWDGIDVHGMDKHHFESYGRLENIVGAPVILVFVCRESDMVLKATYASLVGSAKDGGWFKKHDGRWCRLMHCRYDLLKPWFSLDGQWYREPAQYHKSICKVAPPMPTLPVMVDRYGQMCFF